MVGSLISAIVTGLLYAAFDLAYQGVDSTDSIKATKAAYVLEAAKKDIVAYGVFEVCVGSVLFTQYWNWMAAQWFALSPEQREAWREDEEESAAIAAATR